MSPSMLRCYMLWRLWLTKLAGNCSCGMASAHLMGQHGPTKGCLTKQAMERLLGIGAALLGQHRLNATCLNVLLNRWNTPTYRCTGLLLLLFQLMKSNSKSKKKLTCLEYHRIPLGNMDAITRRRAAPEECREESGRWTLGRWNRAGAQWERHLHGRWHVRQANGWTERRRLLDFDRPAAGSGSKVFEWGVLTKSTGHNDTYQGKSLTILPTGDVASAPWCAISQSIWGCSAFSRSKNFDNSPVLPTLGFTCRRQLLGEQRTNSFHSHTSGKPLKHRSILPHLSEMSWQVMTSLGAMAGLAVKGCARPRRSPFGWLRLYSSKAHTWRAKN